MRTTILVICFTLITFCARAGDITSVCDSYPDVPVNITPVFDSPAYDATANIAQIRALAAESGRSIREDILLGLTRYFPVVKFEAPIKGVVMPNGLACARVDHVDVTFGYKNVTVYIAREIPQNTCGFDQVMAHEQRHIAVNRAILDEYTPRITEKLKAYLKLNGMFREQNANYALTVLRDKMQAILDETSKEIEAENTRRQQDVDSAAEYRRLSNSCNGQLQVIAGQFVRTGR